MGLEASCQVRFSGQEGEGKAHLETSFISFRGPFRLKIPFTEIHSFEARKGWLELETTQGPVALELGSKLAERWYLKLRYPKTLIDKLGVKEDQRVSVLNLDEQEEEFWTFLRARSEDITRGKPQTESDFIFLRVESVDDLSRLADLENSLKRNGSIWLIWPKGQKHIKQSHVMAASKEAGYVDVKIVSFSERLSALKLMIPLERR